MWLDLAAWNRLRPYMPVVPAEALRLMNRHDINHLPVVDADGVLHDFILRRDLGTKVELEATAQLTS